MVDHTLCTLAKRAAELANRGYRFLDYHENETYLRFDELYEKSMETAGSFFRLGIKPQDKIAIIMGTCPEFFYAFFGAQFAGAVPVPLYPPVRLGRMDEYHRKTARMLDVSEARLVCTDKRIKRILGRSLAAAGPDLGCITMDELAKAPYAFDGCDPDAPALIQFSSGTTVDPKPVLLTHRQIIAAVRAMVNFGLTFYSDSTDGSDHCGVSWLPLYHDMGLIGGAMIAITQPGDLVLIPPELFVARPAVWLRAISKYKPIVSAAPNFAFSLCVEKIKDTELTGVDLSTWRVALNAAEPVTPSALEKFNNRFAPYGLSPNALTPLYGLSEAALAVTISDMKQHFVCKRFNHDQLLQGRAKTDDGGKPLVSVGKVLPEYEIEIRDQFGVKIPEGHIGHVFVKGPSVMKGYFGNPEATARAIEDGWLDTGDTGFLMDSELYLYGREKDIIIIRGQNYSPQMIEMSLDNHPGIRDGCVAAAGYIPDDDENEKLIVFIERDKQGDKSIDSELAEDASRKINESNGLMPDSVIVLEPGTILRTSSGKLRRRETLNQYLAGTLAPPKQVNVFRITAEMIRSKIALSRMGKRRNI